MITSTNVLVAELVAPTDLGEVSGCGDLLRLMRFQSG